MSHTPVFIGGAGRSGTTLLADLIGCHPQISPIYETDFLRDFVLFFLASDAPPVNEACVRAIQYMDQWSKALPHRPHNKAEHERYVHGPHYLLFSRDEAMAATVDCVRTIRAGGDAATALQCGESVLQEGVTIEQAIESMKAKESTPMTSSGLRTS